jgi:hypothetical protein
MTTPRSAHGANNPGADDMTKIDPTDAQRQPRAWAGTEDIIKAMGQHLDVPGPSRFIAGVDLAADAILSLFPPQARRTRSGEGAG